MSLAGPGVNDNNCGNRNKDAEHKAICGSTAAGVTFVAAAGNSRHELRQLRPGGLSRVLTVTAMTDTDGLRRSARQPP